MPEDKNDRDDFWDIDKLVPKKRATLSPFASSDPARDYVVPDNGGGVQTPHTERTDEDRRLGSFGERGTRSCEEVSYEPQGESLIKRVTVRHFIDKYDFYDNFRKSALIYFDYRPTARAEFVQFYSYMPQYSQLTALQKAYYFYWRGEMQRGRYIKTDYSYVYLYVYEILNLPDKIPPEEGILLLCRLWREYRRALPRLDNYFSIWVQDYCLVHRLPCPTEQISDFIFDVITASGFKEFYLSDIGRAGSAGTAAMLAYLSDYDWRRGKYAAGDPDKDESERKRQSELYRAYMEGAMSLLLRDLWGECISAGKTGKTELLRRDAFPNSLCTHMVKRKLEIEYYPIAAAGGLRVGVTAAVRYTENKIRALFGIKSRLAVKDLPNDYRRIVDYYFEAIFEREKKRKERESAPAYLRLYDAPDEGMSAVGADEIERASWDTTMRLVEGMEEDDTAATSSVTHDVPVAEPPSAEPAGQSTTDAAPDETGTQTYGLTWNELAYVASLFGDKLDWGYVPDPSVPEDSLVERINEAFADGFGDVVIEPAENGYAVIEDYREDIYNWLLKIRK